MYCNTQHTLHTPSMLYTTRVCMHMHARSPSCLVDCGEVEILLGWISKWTLIEFPTVFLCDTLRPNVVHLKWKGMVVHGKHYFKDGCWYFGWISTFCPVDPIQHYWYQRTKVTASGEVWYSSVGRGTFTRCFCELAAKLKVISPIHSFVLYGGGESLYILTRGALVELVLFKDHISHLKCIISV